MNQMATSRARPVKRLSAAIHLGLDLVREAIGANRRPHILLACMPKSGSTFLAAMIADLPGMAAESLVPAAGRAEQELSRISLARASRRAYIAQHHVHYSDWTQQMIDHYRLTPVVLVRNLYDVAVSVRDHLRRESIDWPGVWFEPHHADLPDADLEMMIARLAMPWYASFYMGWRAAPGALMLDYDDIVADPAGALVRVAGRAGVEARDDAVAAAVAAAARRDARLNVGRPGRGAGLDPAARAHIRALLAHYPEAAGDPYIRRMMA